MKRKLVVFGTFVLFLGIALGAVALILRHEPRFFTRARIAAGPEREELAENFIKKGTLLYNYIEGSTKSWYVPISEAQINSYLQEKFPATPDAKMLERYNISDPRVIIDQDRLRLAFRYGKAPWSTVVSIDVRVWLAQKEANVIALEVLGRRAGAMPISSHSLQEQIKEFCRSNNIDVDWYRYDGNPVALMRIRSSNTKTLFKKLELRPGILTIHGEAPPVLNAGKRYQYTPMGN